MEIPINTIKGDGESRVLGSEDNMVFEFDVDISLFDEDVYIDGDFVEVSDYTYRSGSTIIEFPAAFINNLGVGVHALEVVFADARVGTANFTIIAAGTDDNTGSNPQSPVTTDGKEGNVKVPDTGYFTGNDGNSAENIAIRIAIIVAAVSGVAGIMYVAKMAAKKKINFIKK